MSGFFGFDTQLPERRDPAGARQQFAGFQASNTDHTFALSGAGEEEDLAVYNWGDATQGNLLEGGDDLNDETFGGSGQVGRDFQFSQPAPAPAQPKKSAASAQKQPRGPIASTASRYKPRTIADPFAASEDDFYASRPAPKKPVKIPAQSTPAAPSIPSGSVESLWAKPAQPSPVWGAAGSSMTRPVALPSRPSQTGPPPPGQIKSLDEIEAEMSRVAPAPAPTRPKVSTLEEIEQQMMAAADSEAQTLAVPTPLPREPTPVQFPRLAGSGYVDQQALLDSMFPELGTAAAPGQLTASLQPGGTQPSPEEIAHMDAIRHRIASKIAAMGEHNNVMGSSDKDFITRIQLSQLATADPYASDFYAQVFSALKRSRLAAAGGAEEPSVVQVALGFGVGAAGPAGNRFGKMGTNTMQRLSTQVKKLVENRTHRQKGMGTAALQGALGRVSGGNASGPRPVLAVPMGNRPEHRPVNVLNQQAGPRRHALTRKQVMYALEELYDAVLDLEQARREMPRPTDIEMSARWNADCQGKVEAIWSMLMVMEPLDVSNPHPFISLMNPIKGQRLFPRLLRHLPQQLSLTLLTLLIATYPQLDVVALAPPPPVSNASLLSKVDRLDRARREVETDNFLHCIIPGVDMLIDRCNLGLVSGLLGICAQRMEVPKVASTRPGVALFTALLSKAQSIIRASPPDPMNSQQAQTPDPAEVEQWNKTYAYFLQALLPHLAQLFPSTLAQKAAFGPGAYLLGGDGAEKEGIEMERREAEVWGFAAAMAVNAPEEEQTNLVAALREKILHTVQAARNPSTAPVRAEMKFRNVNMFLNGLGLDASMIE